MKLCAFLLLSLALVGCAPPYIAELNSTAALAQQMTRIATLGPYSTGGSTQSMKFLPAKPTAATLDALNIQSGFLVSRTPGAESLTFVSLSQGGNMQSSGGQVFSLAGADPNYPLYEYNVIATSGAPPAAKLIVSHMIPTSQANLNDVQLFTATLPNGPFQNATPTAQPLVNVFASATAVFAAQVFPVSTVTDNFNFIFLNVTSITEGTAILGAPPTFVFSSGASGSSVPLPNVVNRLLYFRNLSISVASYYTSGQWVCYRWDQPTISAPVLLTGITHPVSALLSTGDLISTDGGTLRVYDQNGSQMTSVPLGGMQFCYEAYVGTTAYVFFSVSMDLPHDSWAFQVYAVPTASLRSLHG